MDEVVLSGQATGETSAVAAEPGGVAGTLCVDFQLQAGAVRVGSHVAEPRQTQTLRRYEDATICAARVEKHTERIQELLGRANRRGKVGSDILAGLEQAGQLLYEELFPVGAKRAMRDAAVEFLALATDDRLVHIPWELAHDGEAFLCRRFSMGRVVSTRQEFAAPRQRLGSPLSLLIVADPQGNLPAAYREGIQLRDLLDPVAAQAEVTLHASQVSRDQVVARLRGCDIFHYAGHADYHVEHPEQSGLLLADGKLRALELRNMVGRSPFPALVFSNACDSGHTQQWHVAEGHDQVYGLANAFLLAGVRHYLGTFWEIPDAPSLEFAKAFYSQLIAGAPVGSAVRGARQAVAGEYGEDAIFWASYMLYGDPAERYVAPESPVRSDRSPGAGPAAIEVGPLRGAASSRPQEQPRFGGKAVLAVGVALAALALVLLARRPAAPPAAPPPAASALDVAAGDTAPALEAARVQAIDALVEDLVQRYRRGPLPPPPERDGWVSQPLTVVFLGIRSDGPTALQRDFLLAAWAEQLQSSPRVTVVERQLLDNLLRELELGTSELADPAAALKLGRIVSANLIVTGSLAREDDAWLVSLRLVETETTAVLASVSSLHRGEDLGLVARAVGEDLLARIGQSLPLQATVAAVDVAAVTLDVGAAVGMQAGQRLHLLTNASEIAGELEVTAVTANRSRARVLRGEPPQVGQRVRQVLQHPGP